MSYARGKSKFMFFPLLLIVFTILFLSGCSSDESSQGNLELGDESALTSDVIGSGGGEIFISPEDADFPGIKLTVPEGAFLMDKPVNVSYKPIEKNGLGEMFTPLTICSQWLSIMIRKPGNLKEYLPYGKTIMTAKCLKLQPSGRMIPLY